MAGEKDRDRWLEQAMAQWEVSLLRTCYLLLRDVSLAEDAVQDTFVKAWQSYDSFRGEASEKSWLMRIAVNTCRDLRRGKWFLHVDRRIRMEDLPEPAVPFRERDDTVTRAILGLPDSLRQAVILRYYQGFPLQEVADLLGHSRRTIHYRLKKAERMLKGSLEEWYDA